MAYWTAGCADICVQQYPCLSFAEKGHLSGLAKNAAENSHIVEH